MRKEIVPDLECPNILRRRKCRGNLQLDVLNQKKNEVIDGFLSCQKCKIKYPVVNGIPILVANLKKYLKDNFSTIKKTIGAHNKIHRDLYVYINTMSYSLYNKKKDKTLFNPAHIEGEKGGWFLLHYGSLADTSHTPLLNDLIELHGKNNAYEIIKGWLFKKDLKNKKAVDIGCNTGGLTHLLAGKCRFSYGVDISYENLFKASRVTKHIPSKLDQYKVNEDGRIKTKKIKIKKMDNIDFILASADNLPFKNKTFQIHISSSVLDIARNNLKILNEAYRTLKKGGEIFLSFVPLFRNLKDKKRNWRLTAENIKRGTKYINFYKEFKNIPFIIRNSENFYNIYDNYCMIGRKFK